MMKHVRGLNFKLDVGLYRLDQQVACQRIGKPFLDANSTKDADLSPSLLDSLKATFGVRAFATA
jgi:hypothetical protein